MVPVFLKIVTTLQDKFNKLYSARAKLEAELNNIYGEINNALDKQDRKVTLVNALVNAPLALNPQQAHINVPAPHPPF